MASRGGCLGVVAVVMLVGAIGSLFDGDEHAETGTSTSASRAEPEPEEEETEQPRSAEQAEESPQHTDEPTDEPSKDQPAEEPREPKLWPVTRVIDGDTVEVRYRGRLEQIRVIGIDTPETVHPSEPVECWGTQSSTVARRWLEDRRVQLVFDPSQGRRDTYDRLLAYITTGRGDFGLAMIRAGNAAEYTYDSSYTNQAAYEAAEGKARARDRGLWRKCGGVNVPLAQPAPELRPSRAPTGGGGGCENGYSPCVPPYPPDVNCDDVDGPITVTGSDPHGLDADVDGTACES